MEIHISRYPVFMKLGYFSHERLVGQEVFVTLALNLGSAYLDLDDDELKSSVDYGSIIKGLETCLQRREVKLIETAVVVLGRTLLSNFAKIHSVQVTLEKPVIPNGLAKGATISVFHHFKRGDELQID